MAQVSYENCLREMFSLHRFGIKLGLDVTGGMLARLGNPHHHYACIHIAGTNGKGSIASALSAVLHAAGYTVGLYTSPHLVRFNERICINGAPLSDPEVVDAWLAVKGAHSGNREATFFEYTTAMALHAFRNAGVDWAVIETGMGGRLDATNILSPAVSVISNISVEHRSYLGDTIAEIAAEKGGIIKPDTPVVTGARQPAAAEVLRNIAAGQSAPFYRLGEHFRVRRTGRGEFSYHGIAHHWPHMRTGLPGNHQIDNAGVVLAACEVLIQQGVQIAPDTIRNSLQSYRWPGRLEIIPGFPPIIIDGAHNLMAARLLARFLKTEMAGRKITLVVGILDDKPYGPMLKALVPVCHRAIVTRPVIDRALPPQTLYRAARRYVSDIHVAAGVKEAVVLALNTTGGQDAVCIAGSLYVAGEAKQALAEIQGCGMRQSEIAFQS